MGKMTRKEAVAALHRARILTAAEKLFSEKGYAQTTIDDISKASEYSRRTLYAYYESKEDILHHIIEKGLRSLKKDIESAAMIILSLPAPIVRCARRRSVTERNIRTHMRP